TWASPLITPESQTWLLLSLFIAWCWGSDLLLRTKRLHGAVGLLWTTAMGLILFGCLIQGQLGLGSGLPIGQMGNSEVGHITLGCGHIVRQDLVKIDDAIADGSFYTNTVLCQAMQQVQTQNGRMHLIGLVSDGGVHSHINHAIAIIDLAKKFNIQPILHMISDGRDTHPQMALKFLSKIQQALGNTYGSIGTISGRYYAMDRDNRWERTEKAWLAIINSFISWLLGRKYGHSQGGLSLWQPIKGGWVWCNLLFIQLA
ncbi:hypothetical protein TI05_14215, partial [Achromatium sp. WMS3]